MSIDRRRLRKYSGEQLLDLRKILTSDVMRGFLNDRREYLVDELIKTEDVEIRGRIHEIDDWGEKEIAAIEKLLEEKSG